MTILASGNGANGLVVLVVVESAVVNVVVTGTVAVDAAVVGVIVAAGGVVDGLVGNADAGLVTTGSIDSVLLPHAANPIIITNRAPPARLVTDGSTASRSPREPGGVLLLQPSDARIAL